MLLGSILQVEPAIVITSQLIEVVTRTVTASQKVSGDPGERIFDVVDRLTAEIEGIPGLPLRQDSEDRKDAAGFTTRSEDAFRYYREAMDYYNKLYGEAAVELLHNHLKRFPDEEEAYESLARIYRSREDYRHSVANWKKIIELDPVDKRPYNYVAYDYFFSGDFDAAD